MFSKTILLSAFAALAAAQSAVLTFTNVPNPVTDGQAQAITFATNDTTTPVSIILRQGPSTDLQDVETLTTNAQNGQFIWTPRADLPNGNNYALQIKQGEEFNYFGPFSVQGASESSSSSSSSASVIVSASPVPSANSTTSVPVIVTPAGTAASASGTGVPVSRNTTMSMATLTATTTSSKTSATGTSTNDAGFQGTGTSSTDAASSTGAASSFQVGSGIALFGAIAAGIFLQ